MLISCWCLGGEGWIFAGEWGDMRFGFFAVLLGIFVAAVFLFVRIWCILPTRGLKIAATALGLCCFCCMFFFRSCMDAAPMPLSIAIYEIGTSWLIFVFYALLAIIAMWLLKLAAILPRDILRDSAVGSAILFGTVAILLTAGYIHYKHKYRQEIELRSPKIEAPVKLVMLSDMHLGFHIRRPELARWVDMINAENPDLVLIAGDIIDMSVRPLEDGDYAEEFRRIKAPVFACVGNHEFISGREKALRFCREAGIRLLMDEKTDTLGLTIIGRNDASQRNRAPLKTMTTDTSGFTILLDHQPNHLDEAVDAGIDFQFSGHTHHGQVWPLSLVTDMLFEDAYGPLHKGGTFCYVTSGLGIWGGKFRVGTKSEYVVATIRPEEK